MRPEGAALRDAALALSDAGAAVGDIAAAVGASVSDIRCLVDADRRDAAAALRQLRRSRWFRLLAKADQARMPA